jgi:hypothetical protein
MRRGKAGERASDLASVIAKLQSEGITSLCGLAKSLTDQGIPTARGGNAWLAKQVSRVMAKLRRRAAKFNPVARRMTCWV